MKYEPVFLEKSEELNAKGVSDLLPKTGNSRPLFQDLGDDDEENEEEITIASNQSGKSKRGRDKTMWTIVEDKALCSAYTKARRDVVNLTNNQKRNEFWASIMRMFDDAQKENPLTINQRGMESCKSRWRRINLIVSEWVEVYKEAQQKSSSDSNEDSVLVEAREMWEKANNGQKFLLEHCWDILKQYPKWQGGVTLKDQGSEHKSKKSNSDMPTTQNVEVPPPSVKRSRNKGKPNISSQDDIDSVNHLIDRQNTNNCEIDANQFQLEKQMFEFWKEKERFQLEKQMFEFWKEKERKRQAKRDERRRFKLYYTLMGKSILSLDEAQLYARLHEEYKNI